MANSGEDAPESGEDGKNPADDELTGDGTSRADRAIDDATRAHERGAPRERGSLRSPRPHSSALEAGPGDASEARPRRRKKQRRRAAEPLPPPVQRASERTVRGYLLAGAGAAIAGVAIVGTRESMIGEILAVGGLLTLIASIHKLGRLGPDEPSTQR